MFHQRHSFVWRSRQSGSQKGNGHFLSLGDKLQSTLEDWQCFLGCYKAGCVGCATVFDVDFDTVLEGNYCSDTKDHIASNLILLVMAFG